MKLNPLIRIRDASTISIARAVIAAVTFLAGALLAALPATAQGRALKGSLRWTS